MSHKCIVFLPFHSLSLPLSLSLAAVVSFSLARTGQHTLTQLPSTQQHLLNWVENHFRCWALSFHFRFPCLLAAIIANRFNKQDLAGIFVLCSVASPSIENICLMHWTRHSLCLYFSSIFGLRPICIDWMHMKNDCIVEWLNVLQESTVALKVSGPTFN